MEKILNVGCAHQTFGTHFIDLYPQRKGVIKCDVERGKLPFPDRFFDEVYSENLFEHLKNPNKALEEMIRVLKKGGKLILITDNASFWGWHTPFSGAHFGRYERISYGEEDRHYALYTPWHLENHLRSLKMERIGAEYLFLDEKNPFFVVRVISKLMGLVYKRVAYPQLKVVGFKG
ncbi:hypothetical protein A3K63_00970 [Candidatus Micrarchaeota archaeon RBG_16_49_10]|nr:MAG: hypothetical protein A3K63_00970 [Candidatus Micrarchaeota archaeon RBG_16_49_10]